MSEDTIYDRVERLEDGMAALRRDINILLDMHRNKLVKLEVQRIKDGGR